MYGTTESLAAGVSNLVVNFAVVRSDEVAANSRIIKVVKNGIRHNIAFDRGSFVPGKSYNTISKFDKFPANSIPGVFAMGGKKVVFSKGNLYWDGTSSLFKFEDHQYSYTEGEYHKWDPNHVCQFFCFRNGESARGATPPTLPIDDRFFTEADEFSVYGMGKYFWRTMSYYEWNFCLARDNKIGMATISGSGVNVKGIVLLPDVFDNPLPNKAFVKYVKYYSSWESNTYTTEEWEEMEAEGAVLLPFTGTRSNNNNMIEVITGYWSSTVSLACRRQRSATGAGLLDCTDGVHLLFPPDGKELVEWDKYHPSFSYCLAPLSELLIVTGGQFPTGQEALNLGFRSLCYVSRSGELYEFEISDFM